MFSLLCCPALHRIPFLFSSTSLVAEPDAYGSMKRLGESWVASLRIGRIARLWNIYGPEPSAPSRKSHVLADWAAKCVSSVSSSSSSSNSVGNGDGDGDISDGGSSGGNSGGGGTATGTVRSLTDGAERRQFVHVDDCADGLGAAMEHYDSLELVTDITSSEWVTMRQEVAQAFRPACHVLFADHTPAAPRSMLEPKMQCDFHRKWWKPQRTLQQGVAELIQYYRDRQQQQPQQQLLAALPKDEL